MADSTKHAREDAVLPRPRGEGAMAEAERAAADLSSGDRPLGQPGAPLNRRSPFYIGLTGTAGVLLALAAGYLVVAAGSTLVLVGLALFIAVGMHPLVTWLADRGVRRALAVTAVAVAMVLVIAGFLASAIVPLLDQGGRLVQQVAGYLQGTGGAASLGRLNQRFHLVDQVRTMVGTDGGQGPEAVGRLAIEATSATVVVIVLSIYFLADMPRVRRTLYRLVPASRRPRVILIGDEVFTKVGAYLLGNLLISLITGCVVFAWLLVAGVPYALLLAIVVAALDLVPVAGSLVAGALVAAFALTVSLPVCLGTIGVFLGYKLVEDYLLLPKIIGRVVAVPPLVTLVAVLLGAALGGVVGAVVAIPLAGALQLVVTEVSIPRLDEN